MKTFTIINNSKLVGIIKLNDEIVNNLPKNAAILLEQEINRGDAQIVTLRLSLVGVNVVEGRR